MTHSYTDVLHPVETQRSSSSGEMGNQLVDGFQTREVHRKTSHEQEEAVDFQLPAAWAYSWEGAA